MSTAEASPKACASSGLGVRRLVTGVIKVWRVGSEMWVDVGRAVAFNYVVQFQEHSKLHELISRAFSVEIHMFIVS